MSITYVTALYNINSDYTVSTNLIENVKILLKQKINIILFVDNYFYEIFIKENIPNNIDLLQFDLEDNQIYTTILRENPELPINRNLEKDTLKYIALMNSKIEFIKKALPFVNTPYIAWIDAGIAKIFKSEKTLSKLENLKIVDLENILIPGAYKRNLQFSELFQNIFWVFLGGFFICNKNIVLKFYDLSISSINKFLSFHKISWEVNVWIDIYNNNDKFFEWYKADHNDSIIEIPECFRFEYENSDLKILKNRASNLRFSGKNSECYDLCREILEIEKNPFSSTNEDLSIVSYYVGKFEEGRLSAERVLFSEYNEKKTTAMSNISFYLNSLKSKKIEIFYKLPENYFPSSPSIIIDEDKYIYNIRAVNYTIRSDGSYDIKDPNGIVRTKNFVLILDKNFKTLCDFELSDDVSILEPRYKSHILGLEDVRLFSDKNNQKYFFATCCETLPFFCPRIVFGSFDDTGKLIFLKALKIPNSENKNCEKNWLPFVTEENEIRFIYTISPLTIYKIDRDTFEVSLVFNKIEKEFYDYEFRGSAPPISYMNGWLLTIHQVLYSSPRKYYHRLIWYNKDFTERKFGPLFYFEKIGFEYNLSICKSLISDDLLFTYSINDGCQKICSVSFGEINEQLNFSNYLLTNYIYTEPKIVNPKDKKICLCMIVKNEHKIIERCLQSCKKILDYISICDTGSTDNTVEIIENFCKKHGIPGKVHHHEWKNFGYNRTLSYNTARETFPDADYCLLIDADMQLEVLPDFDKSKLNAGGYQVAQQNSSLYYFNTRLLGTKYNWKCVGVTHEYWSPEDPKCVSKQLTSLIMPDHGDGGCKDDKFDRDIRLLTQGLIDEPNNERYMFYLAQSYHDIGKYKEAIYWYRKRIKAAGWYEEVYYSYYRIARCKFGQKRIWEEVEQAYEEAWNYCNSRMEPIYEIGKHYQENEEYNLAYKWLKKASAIPFPHNQVLFIYKDIYDFRVWDALGISCYYIGKYKEGIDACIKALKSSFCSSHDTERIKNNMRFCLDKLRN